MDRDEILKILSTHDLTEDEELYFYEQLYFTNQLNNKGDEQIQNFHEQQKSNRDSILIEIAKVMLSYPIVNTIMSIGDSDKIKLQSRLNGLVNKKIQSELKSETLKTNELLKYIGEHKYNTINYINNLNSEKVKSDKLDKIINTKVDEKLWSDRLWDNKNQTAADLRKEIKKFLNGETTVNQIEEVIKKKYNTNAFNTKRLVIDNIARVQEGINDVWREEHGIKRVLYLATLCHNTCDNCRQYDGREYPADRKPVDLPQHNFCRCTYVNLPYKGWRPAERIDNDTKERIPWQDYKEWYIKNTVEARADKYITNVTDGERIDTIQPRNIFKELNKSSIGRETIEYIENNNLNIEFKYFNILEGVRGIHWGQNQIEIFIPNTKTKVLTAQTLIHEVTHVKYNIRDTQWSEAVCFLKEKEHLKGTLTVQDKRDTIKLVKQLYPELPWR